MERSCSGEAGGGCTTRALQRESALTARRVVGRPRIATLALAPIVRSSSRKSRGGHHHTHFTRDTRARQQQAGSIPRGQTASPVRYTPALARSDVVSRSSPLRPWPRTSSRKPAWSRAHRAVSWDSSISFGRKLHGRLAVDRGRQRRSTVKYRESMALYQLRKAELRRFHHAVSSAGRK